VRNERQLKTKILLILYCPPLDVILRAQFDISPHVGLGPSEHLDHLTNLYATALKNTITKLIVFSPVLCRFTSLRFIYSLGVWFPNNLKL
jgi:hypothetical protein